ncbi:hypothetical protein [Mycobacterium phage WXIN]|nr:hypothetical protein [Mycobacterium phage WXIN]
MTFGPHEATQLDYQPGDKAHVDMSGPLFDDGQYYEPVWTPVTVVSYEGPGLAGPVYSLDFGDDKPNWEFYASEMWPA